MSDGDTLIATRFVSNERDPAASLYYGEGYSFERTKPTVVSEMLSKRTVRLNTEESLEGVAGARSESVTGEGPFFAWTRSFIFRGPKKACLRMGLATCAGAVPGTWAPTPVPNPLLCCAAPSLCSALPHPPGESDYHLTFSEMGSRVVLVASEPVTSSASDWAEVPRNTALVVAREKGDILAVLQSPLCLSGCHPRQEEVSHCLEAVTSAAGPAREGVKGPGLAVSEFLARQGSDQISGGQVPEASEDTRGQPSANGKQSPLEVSCEEHTLTHSPGHAVMALWCEEGLLFSGSTDCSIKVWWLHCGPGHRGGKGGLHASWQHESC